MLLYNQIIPLNKDKHRRLRLNSADGDTAFAAKTHYVPVAATEFFQASRDYPLIFAGDTDGGPVALLGLRENENLFSGKNGDWAANTYVPAFVRRYPFVLAKGDEGDNFTVCFDESYPAFNSNEGEALFEENGKYTVFLNRIIDFLQQYRAEMLQTTALVERLNALDLLIQRDLEITTRNGERFSLRGFRVVDEERLRTLADGKVGELVREGYMGWIYAHLVSLNNLARLGERLPASVDVDNTRPDGEGANTETEPEVTDEVQS
ncbi:SapC family protein [Spiribacter vilamensis]|uniref:SapC protein n=2 Tax=Spiribacter vilamensis TaxID=531306 RepID=A0A4Q8D2Q1_9GAMM|nr:SapC protein [Spiribacter vilamensis]TVO62379.1 SapC family protein [Spiribacter vilamensis]